MRSGKWLASVTNPLAPIGDPMMSRTGLVVSESAPRMSYVSTAPGAVRVLLVCSASVVIGRLLS